MTQTTPHAASISPQMSLRFGDAVGAAVGSTVVVDAVALDVGVVVGSGVVDVAVGLGVTIIVGGEVSAASSSEAGTAVGAFVSATSIKQHLSAQAGLMKSSPSCHRSPPCKSHAWFASPHVYLSQVPPTVRQSFHVKLRTESPMAVPSVSTQELPAVFDGTITSLVPQMFRTMKPSQHFGPHVFSYATANSQEIPPAA